MGLETIDFVKAPWGEIDAVLVGLDAKQSARDYYLGKCVLQVHARELWRAAGFASLANYFEIRLGWDPHTTAERARTARALEELPLISQSLREGRIRWSAAREMTRIAEPSTEAKWLTWSVGKNTHAIALAVKARNPGDLPTDPARPENLRMKITLDCGAEEYAVIRQAIRHVRDCLGEAGRELTEAACLKMVLCGGVEQMKLDLTLCPSCRAAGVRVAGEILPIPPALAESAACSAQIAGEDGVVRSRHLPKHIERAVQIRANRKCEVPFCRFRLFCQVHHLRLWSEGGGHSMSLLMNLCSAHHRLHHDGLLLIEGSRQDGFVFRHPDGTEIGKLPAYDRVAAFQNAFQALVFAGLPEGGVREALRVVRERETAGTEEEILTEVTAILTAAAVDGVGGQVAEAAAPYGLEARSLPRPLWDAVGAVAQVSRTKYESQARSMSSFESLGLTA